MEAKSLCNVAEMLTEGQKNIRKKKDYTNTHRLINMLTEDIVTACKTNNAKLNEISKAFGFNKEHIQILSQ